MNIGEDLRMSLRSIQKRPVESLLLVLGVALGIGATAAGISMVSRAVHARQQLLSSTQYREIVATVREDTDQMDVPAMAVNTATQGTILTSADLKAKNDLPDIQYAYIANREEYRTGNGGFDFRFNDRNRQNGSSGTNSAGGATSGATTGTQGSTATGNATQGSQGNVTVTTTGNGQFLFRSTRNGQGNNTTTTQNGNTTQGATAQAQTGQSGSAQNTNNQGGNAQAGGPPGGPPPGGFPGFPQSNQPMPATPAGPQPVLDQFPGYEVSPEFFDAWHLHAVQGSLFTDADIKNNAAVMVLGSHLATTLYADGKAYGRELIIRRTLYKITGILAPSGTVHDNEAFTPAVMIDTSRIPGFALQFAGLNTSLHFAVSNVNQLEQAKSQLQTWFTQQYGEGAVVLSVPREEVQAATDRSARLVTVILFLALSALLIASVNVSNILLGRAMRKRKNVGILKALGATIRDVFGLFFVEALIIGVGGAILGAGISIGISKLMATTIAGGTIISVMLFLGILGAWAITTSLTVIPALQASRIPAAEALRYE